MKLEPNIWLWLIAFVPLGLLLFLMLFRRWGAAEAGVVGWMVTALIALTVFKLPVDAIGLKSVKGFFESITIIYIILAAILIYDVAKEANAFEPLQRGMTRIFAHPLLQIMAIGWVFGGFLQGITGFGVPVAVCAPLLIGIGVRPAYAVAIALIGQAWNNTFGTLGAAWLGLEQVTKLSADQSATTAWQTALLILVVVVASGFVISWMYGGFRGLREGLVAVLSISVAQGGVTIALAKWNPTLNGFAAGLAALLVAAGLARLPMYRRPSRVTNSRVLEPAHQADAMVAAPRAADTVSGGRHTSPPAPAAAPGGAMPMTLSAAFIPYGTLLVVTCVVLLVGPLNEVLSRPSVGLSFPSTNTGLGVVTEGSTERFEFATHAGTLLLVTAVISYVVYRKRGHLDRGTWRRVLSSTVEKSVAPTIAVITLVGMAEVMQASGQAAVLATQVAVWTGGIYLLLAPMVGLFGTFITGSNMSSNLLFGNFQQATAQAGGLSTSAVLSAQTAGAATASAIAPSKILLGTTTAAIAGQEGKVLRLLLPFAVGVTLVVGLITTFLLN
ncbi:L-lactate permease [Streptomyces sp. B-S-A8]|uniref:L-lactate permease n=1 Tax=Streptomyces solicavernae TaxID=3043614 RepID=A0ABT6RYS9_9ACTN|nr:L-lactate permease [Streptomyces sp. B-S-A8]MDI3389557.1 L-lactate permease [Streptomyces sp. B-S-A8]